MDMSDMPVNVPVDNPNADTEWYDLSDFNIDYKID